jgi:hypothetical protein
MSLFAMFFLTVAGMAQQPVGTTPMPAEILTAKTVFISNTGAIPMNVSGGSNRLYSSFYQQLQAVGTFRIVNDPRLADLILEPHYLRDSNLRLRIYDRTTRVLLWTVNQSVELCTLQKTCDRNLDSAIAGLVMQVRQLSAETWVPTN